MKNRAFPPNELDVRVHLKTHCTGCGTAVAIEFIVHDVAADLVGQYMHDSNTKLRNFPCPKCAKKQPGFRTEWERCW